MVRTKLYFLSRGIWLTLLLLLPLIAIIIPFEWIDGDGAGFCLWKNLTGHECYGCGILRAGVSMMQLKFAQSWYFNKLIVVVLPLLGWQWFRQMRLTIRELGLDSQISTLINHNTKQRSNKVWF